MCLAVPGKVTSVVAEGAGRIGTVDFGSSTRTVDLVFVPEAGVGDWVITHSGYALRLISEEDAAATIELLETMPPW
jgi:hydrogenase expression/formation protein HypC